MMTMLMDRGKKHGSSLNKGHYFVLAPLGGIGPCFRTGELVGLMLWHVSDAVLMNSRDLCLGRSVQGMRNLLFEKLYAWLVRQSAASEYKWDD